MKNEETLGTEKKQVHISSYYQLGIILVVLLFLTFLSVFVAAIHFGALSIVVALLVASIKGTTVATYFMHLKYEKPFMRIMVGGVFFLFALVILITFIDYFLR
ncbi:cytochrome C oxidase subunit IV family protein [Saccharicrinis sp. FJH62]|uniref:cytochrome C oxidase subunit IV family protein n=1 Tax=Saccharicrinis sp. FJH62 TaxID=3344657 RepID=UPI0035D50431